MKHNDIATNNDSNFVCDCCNNEYNYEYDYSYYCNNGHNICDDCLRNYAYQNKIAIAKFLLKLKMQNNIITKKEYKSLILKIICGDDNIFEYVLYYFFDTDNCMPIELCPTCNNNSYQSV